MEWNPERARIEEEKNKTARWSRWGPYLSDRQWGTVREDYSADGDAWNAFPFDHARTRAYRWGEDGIFGICDMQQRLCVAPAFWNGNDAILKERFFGLSGHQGNHGEDVKEHYYYLDNVPSHAYMKALYKYPQAAYPYDRLVAENARRTRADPEFELLDTGIFDGDAYFDIVVEYAKRSPTDLLMRVTATNRGSQTAPLHVVPQFWFRNMWSWSEHQPHGTIAAVPGHAGAFDATQIDLGTYRIYTEGSPVAHFTENETNLEAMYGAPNPQPFVKDGIDRAIVRGETGATNSRGGSKLGLDHAFDIAPGADAVVRIRLVERDATDEPMAEGIDVGFDETFAERAWEADRFYALLNPHRVSGERRDIQRAAFAGLLWSKQFYFYVIRDWLAGDPLQPPPPPERRTGRNHNWQHLYNDRVLSMPDTWEYPWYASWDLAFHTIALALVDPEFAKEQLIALTRERYMHPNGDIPAYEWAFGDVNPPVQAWAAYRIYQIDRKMNGVGDRTFLERVFQKLLLNFTWWVNREDPSGENVFEGGFMGLDNIGIFDRSRPLPMGGRLIQSDSTSWMAVYALDMMAIAVELALHDSAYEDMATKFFEHFIYIANAMNDLGDDGKGLWDDADGFYYDQLVAENGTRSPLRVRSLVGLTPLFAVQPLRRDVLERLPNFKRRIEWFVAHRPELCRHIASMDAGGTDERRLLAVMDGERLHRVLRTMLDEAEFLSPHGVRSLSRRHRDHPLVIDVAGREFRIDYDPAESRSDQFGGNSNWRGPVWMPINFLIVEALQNFHFFYGDSYRVEYPSGSGNLRTLWDVSTDISERLVKLFERDGAGNRPFNGGDRRLQTDPHFRDRYLFHEYFDGDDGAGLGASHQTGWTALVAKLIQQIGEYSEPGARPGSDRPSRFPAEDDRIGDDRLETK